MSAQSDLLPCVTLQLAKSYNKWCDAPKMCKCLFKHITCACMGVSGFHAVSGRFFLPSLIFPLEDHKFYVILFILIIIIILLVHGLFFRFFI